MVIRSVNKSLSELIIASNSNTASRVWHEIGGALSNSFPVKTAVGQGFCLVHYFLNLFLNDLNLVLTGNHFHAIQC